MPFISGLVKNVFILRWQGTQFADGANIVRRVKEARSLCPGPLVYVAIVPPGEGAPDMATRRELGRRLDEVLGLCACVHLILEGEGFRAATQRAAATGIFLMMGQRGRVTAHASVSDALSRCPNLAATAPEILAKGRAFGVVLEDAPRHSHVLRQQSACSLGC
jgi:hypothetical protein